MTPEETADLIAEALPAAEGRRLIAVAGSPASGKTTLAAVLAERLGPSAALVAMDGFHLDNSILDARGLRARKGAPETFDLGGFRSLIARLSEGDNVIVPGFDRARDISINCLHEVPATRTTVVVEGNYLLLDEPGWRDLSALWDFSVFLDVPEDVLEGRLIQRWLDHGFDPDAARARAMENDIPNARRIMANRLEADLVI